MVGLNGISGHLVKFLLHARLAAEQDLEHVLLLQPVAAVHHVSVYLMKLILAVQQLAPIALVNIPKCSQTAVIHAIKHATV